MSFTAAIDNQKDASKVSSTLSEGHKNSLLKRFQRAIIWLYILTVIVSIPAVYLVTREQVHAEANKELSLMVDMVKSVREFIAEDVRPALLEANMFHPPAVSSTVATGKVAGHFLQKQPNYYIKVAADNPLNAKNKPEPLEQALLARFRNDSSLDGIVETGQIHGRTYLVSSRPSKAKEGCLLCHGDSAQAPEAITDLYGTSHGYGWKVGEVVGASVVGVPMADVNALVMQRGLAVIGIFTLVFGIIFIIINRLVKQRIVNPVIEITGTAIAISKGDLNREVEIARDGGEIGELGNAVELLRRSLVKAMERIQQR